MKLLIIPAAVGLIWLLAGCRSVATQQSWDNLELLRADMEADGVITPEEASEYSEAVAAHFKLEKEEMESMDWKALLGTAGGTLLAAFLGINGYRNRGLPGTTRKG